MKTWMNMRNRNLIYMWKSKIFMYWWRSNIYFSRKLKKDTIVLRIYLFWLKRMTSRNQNTEMNHRITQSYKAINALNLIQWNKHRIKIAEN
jgi:hypothetical protein